MPIRFRIRSYSRFHLECPVYFLGPRFLGKGTVLNLSKGGSRIQGDHPVRKGTPLALRVLLPDQTEPVCIERARVRWSNGHEFGLQITQVPHEEYTRLARFLRILVYRPFFWRS